MYTVYAVVVSFTQKPFRESHSKLTTCWHGRWSQPVVLLCPQIGDETTISMWSSKPREGLTICRCQSKGQHLLLSCLKAPSTLTHFQKCLFSSQRKQSRLFSSTLAFSNCFHLSTLKGLKMMKTTETGFLMC